VNAIAAHRMSRPRYGSPRRPTGIARSDGKILLNAELEELAPHSHHKKDNRSASKGCQ